jgi:hypothetical protein
MQKFSIGADPEIFLQNSAGQFKSVIGLLGADKWHPRKLSEVGHAVLEDNVAVEFNIPPCTTFADFKKEIQATMQMVKEILPSDLQYNQDSAVSFPASELACDAAWVFGCEPDFNAWTIEENPKPCAEDKNLRSCGGHIHVGSDLAIADPIAAIRAMDLYLGVPSVVLDKGTLRRNLYGKAGAFRFKPYGVEYRTLSNFWIFSDNLLQWAYTGTQRALDFLHSGKELPEEHGNLIQDCINNNNTNAYNELHKLYAV